MKDLLRNIGESVFSPEERERTAKEAAIVAWESDPERNPENLKVVRGANGFPVEIVMRSQSQAAFAVNGQERPFAVADLLSFSSFNDPIPSLCLEGGLQEGYDVKAVQRIDYGSKSKPLDVLTGALTGTPPGLVVSHKDSPQASQR